MQKQRPESRKHKPDDFTKPKDDALLKAAANKAAKTLNKIRDGGHRYASYEKRALKDNGKLFFVCQICYQKDCPLGCWIDVDEGAFDEQS